MQNHLESIPNNPLIGRTAPDVNAAETLLPRVTKRTLAQLRAGKSPLLKEYLHRIGKADDPGCTLCENGVHNTAHLFECTQIPSALTPLDLLQRPAEAVSVLEEWQEALALAEEGWGAAVQQRGGMEKEEE